MEGYNFVHHFTNWSITYVFIMTIARFLFTFMKRSLQSIEASFHTAWSFRKRRCFIPLKIRKMLLAAISVPIAI